jgi:hypothetical protein
VADTLSDGMDLLDYVFTVVTNSLSSVLQTVWGYVLGTVVWIENAATTVGHWIDGTWDWLWAYVIAPAIQLVRDALNYAVDVLQWIIAQVANNLAWLLDNVIAPAWDWIEHAVETVGGWIWDAVEGFYHNVILPLLADAEWWAHLLASAWDWLTHEVVAVVNIVIKAWDWLVWMGEHTFDDLTALFDGADAQATREQLLGVAGSEHGAYDFVEHYLERILA